MSLRRDFRDSLLIEGKIFDFRHFAESDRKFKFDTEILSFINQWISDDAHITVKTSGTTGKPKQIKIHKDVLVFSAINTGNFLNLKRNDKALLCLPIEFIAGKMMVVRAFVLGLDLYFQKPKVNFEINDCFDFCAMTPMQLENCVENGSLTKIKKVIVGGAQVRDALKVKLQHYSTQIFETYGMTETSSHIALRKINGQDRTDHFCVLEGIDIKTNEESQLIINSKGLKLKNLVTNDIVKIIDTTNSFIWVGRKDNVINSGGIKLYPESIEAKLKSVIKNDFFIFGIHSEKFGQSPVIAVEGNCDVNLEEVFKSRLTKYEIPQKVLHIKNFIRTESGKVNRIETINSFCCQL